MRQAGCVFDRPPCPCGSGGRYDACCEPLHLGAALADDPEQLMRSRYAAYAVGDGGYLLRTWHPRTRPDALAPDPGTTWTGLEVLGSGVDWVEFVASWSDGLRAGSLRERSRFAQRGGRWLYLDGVVS